MTTYTADQINAFRADPNFLFIHSEWVRDTVPTPTSYGYQYRGRHDQTAVFKDTTIPIGKAQSGSKVLIDGREAIVSGGQKNVEVRYFDDGMPARIQYDYPVTIVGLSTNYADWYPKRGSIVKVLKGEHADRVGIVYSPGKLSTYVAFTDTEEKIKFNAKYLQIVKGRIVLD